MKAYCWLKFHLFCTTNATASDLAKYQAGMQFADASTGKCKYGHNDLDGSALPISDTRQCPKSDGTYCGFDIDYFDCTCVSRERALAAYSSDGYWAAFWVFIGFGTFIYFFWMFTTYSS